MRKLLFFSRVTFICNICFLVTFLMHYIPALQNGVVPSTIIILGNVVALFINIIINIIYIGIKVAGRPLFRFVPGWLVTINFLFFVFQIILLVK